MKNTEEERKVYIVIIDTSGEGEERDLKTLGMSETEITIAFAVLSGYWKTLYSVGDQETEFYLGNERPNGEKAKNWGSWHGYSSDEAYSFMRRLAHHDFGTPREAQVWYLQQTDGNGNVVGNNVVYEITTAFDRHLVGGMTDYSGEGGAAYHETHSALKLLSMLWGFPITKGLVPAEESERFYDRVRAHIDEQLREMVEAD